MRIKGFEYLDGFYVTVEPDQLAILNKSETLIEIRINNVLMELIPLASLRTIIPYGPSPRKVRCRWCQKETNTKPCEHCERV